MTMPPDLLKLFKETPGALSVAEAMAVRHVAAQVPYGVCVECGSYRGKSAIAAESAIPGLEVFHLIDPCFGGLDVTAKRQIIYSVRCASSRLIGARLHAGLSAGILPLIEGQFAWAFLDSGDHSYELVRTECNLVAPRMMPGGIIGFHDLRSQFTGVERAYNELLASGDFEEAPIPWAEIESIVRGQELERGNSSWHHPELECPMFFGALRRK